jgi:hypothetical protein
MAKVEHKWAYLAEHLHYEWWMLNHAFERALESSSANDTVATNAFLESFWLHARICTDFLRNEGTQNDMKARSYIDRYEIKGAPPPKLLQRLNDQITHFSTGREKAQKLDATDMKSALEWLNYEMGEFRMALPDGDRANLAIVEEGRAPTVMAMSGHRRQLEPHQQLRGRSEKRQQDPLLDRSTDQVALITDPVICPATSLV